MVTIAGRPLDVARKGFVEGCLLVTFLVGITAHLLGKHYLETLNQGA